MVILHSPSISYIVISVVLKLEGPSDSSRGFVMKEFLNQ